MPRASKTQALLKRKRKVKIISHPVANPPPRADDILSILRSYGVEAFQVSGPVSKDPGMVSSGATEGSPVEQARVTWDVVEQLVSHLDALTTSIQSKVHDQLAYAYGPVPTSTGTDKEAVNATRMEDLWRRLTHIVDTAAQVNNALDAVGGCR